MARKLEDVLFLKCAEKSLFILGETITESKVYFISSSMHLVCK